MNLAVQLGLRWEKRTHWKRGQRSLQYAKQEIRTRALGERGVERRSRYKSLTRCKEQNRIKENFEMRDWFSGEKEASLMT